ncbi:phage virion morphogenesis protein [Colwellia psychrerythraea]|uniref:Phage virion morphogenesis protein n=1 Tax=Colwellia psychrerythraea TaxID=28229 RepID=A0A099KNV6_COLPS|nr:phage virion morphogenesis protein [Colwellia psychrerythraea]KGJ92126.1 phage virion morphogenesis protein [Colwellia psychrerythraea]
MAGVHLEITGLNPVKQVFNRLQSLDVNELLTDIGEAYHDDVLSRFDTEQAPDGTQWQASQRAIDEGGKTLTDTAILRDSFHYEINGDQLLYGSSEVYAAIHNFGGDTGRRKSTKLPQREIIGLSAKQLRIIGDTATDFLNELLP